MEPRSRTLNVGDPAPDFTLFTAEGDIFCLSESYAQRAVLLIWIRGTW